MSDVTSKITSVAQATTPQHAAVLERLGQLEIALLEKDPLMKGHLLEIHKHLIQFEELVHLLKDDEIGVLMAAQQVHTNTVLIGSASTAAGKAKAIKAGAKLGVADL